MQPELKRGYVKWVDEDGTRHKVTLDEYNAVAELEGKPTIEGESAPPRGPAIDNEDMDLVIPNVVGEPAPEQPLKEEVPDEDFEEVPDDEVEEIPEDTAGNNGHNTETNVQMDSAAVLRDS